MNRKIEESDMRKRVAFHEAGHVAMAECEGAWNIRAYFCDEEDCDGMTEYANRKICLPGYKDPHEDLISVAGRIAEGMMTGESWRSISEHIKANVWRSIVAVRPHEQPPAVVEYARKHGGFNAGRSDFTILVEDHPEWHLDSRWRFIGVGELTRILRRAYALLMQRRDNIVEYANTLYETGKVEVNMED